MKDFNGVELLIGDPVAYIDGYAGSAVYLSKGFVKGFTPTMVRVVKTMADGSDVYSWNVKPARLTLIKG